MYSHFNAAFTITLISLLIFTLFSSCDVLKLGTNIDKIEERSDTIGMKLSAGLLSGLDTSRVDALVDRIFAQAGKSLKKEMDSVEYQQLRDSLKVVVLGVLNEGVDSIKDLMSDTTQLDGMDRKLQSIVEGITAKMDKTVARLIPNLLEQENLAKIYELRDSLLGATTTELLKNVLTTSLESLVESQELDSLITRITTEVDRTTDKVDQSAQGISKTVARIGLTIGGILLALAVLFFVLWFRKRSLAKQQEALVLNLTKAIDAIPTKEDYDHTIAFLQEIMNAKSDSKLHEILNGILTKNEDQYPQKKKYKTYYLRLIELLKNNDANKAIQRQLLDKAEDDDFRKFIEEELIS